MAKWFKRTKRGGTTYTTYLDGSKPTTWSQSYTDGSTRRTYTHRGGKTTLTVTSKQGGYRKIEKKLLNKKQKPIKYKPPKKIRVKWNKSLRYRKRRTSTKTQSISIKALMYLLLLCFLPMVLEILF